MSWCSRCKPAGHGEHGAAARPTVARRNAPLVLSIAAGIRVADIVSLVRTGDCRGARHAQSPGAQQRRRDGDLRAAGLERCPPRTRRADVLGAVGTTGVGARRRRARRGDGAVGQRAGLFLPARRAHDRCRGRISASSAPARGSSRSRRCSAPGAWRATATATWRGCAPRSPPRAAPPRPRCAHSRPRICVVSSPPRSQGRHRSRPRDGPGIWREIEQITDTLI